MELKNCGLDKIPPEVFKFSDLVFVDFSNDPFCDEDSRNKITEIPDEISNLKKLVTLNLANNSISSLSEKIFHLKKLKTLNLSGNNLLNLPVKVANMPSLEELIIDDNPFEMLPPEIIARGIDSIRNFFKELAEKDYLYEVKLILVGEGRVGKTCLSRALINDNYQLSSEESTEGININRWVIPQSVISEINNKIERDFQINIWDFGGQEIYHSTHQFFLTKRSLYLHVTESRKEDSHDDFFYWLNVIKLLGGKSPVVMVLNKCDQPTKDLPIKEYKEAFTNIVDLYKISLKTEFRDSFNEFKYELIKLASELPHIGNPLPKVWVDIRIEIEELKQSGVNYISESQYFEICKKHYRDEQSALFLSEYFHDLGVLLHFKEDIELRDIVILNHEWITTGVYKILDDKKVIDQKGRFNIDDLKRIWSGKEYRNKIRELLSLMKNKKFDLCFELNDGEYLAPRLLPVDEIDHNWITSNSNLKFEFRYKFMPKGILARFIVKLNEDIEENKFWRYGVILKHENTSAIIKEKYFENKITIDLAGSNKREFLFIIRKSINEIHKDFNKLKVAEMVPCVCNHCKSIEFPSFYDFNLLQRYELKGIGKIRCDNSLEEVNVYELTSDMKSQVPNDKLFFCENQNFKILNNLGLEKLVFTPEKDSSSVFIKVKTYSDKYGLRDRDFLLDSEIKKIRKKYPNYRILNYYCIENYLYHPENISELNLKGFNIQEYTNELVKQKNQKKDVIISVFRNSRNSYQEFKIESENLRAKKEENDIITYLNSNDIEVFLKAYSLKDHFDKSMISKYNLKPMELAATDWFKKQISTIILQT